MAPSVQAIINSKAGSAGPDDWQQNIERLITSAFAGARVLFPEEGSDVTAIAREAVRNGAELVIAGGGDGTINAVAAGLVGTDAMLGVLPLGTLNHFAKDLGMPLEPEAAIEAIRTGSARSVDVGQVNETIFINNSGLGLYPTIVHLRENKQEAGASKWPAALSATIRSLAQYRVLTIRIEVDGKQLVRRTPIVFVGNNEYKLEGVRLPTRATLDDGQLCLYIPHPTGRARLLWFSLRALLGDPRKDQNFDAILTRQFRIDSRHSRLAVSIDGEVRAMKTPLDYRILAGALRVMSPTPTT
ncbi:MAG: diacylglycerol kinase family protein [Gemmatimonadota bacterium]